MPGRDRLDVCTGGLKVWVPFGIHNGGLRKNTRASKSGSDLYDIDGSVDGAGVWIQRQRKTVFRGISLPFLSSQWKFIQFGTCITPRWIVVLKNLYKTLAVIGLEQVH